MNNKVDIKSFVGLDYRQVRLLMKRSCIAIDKMANTLLAMESADMLLCESFCKEYELLLLERLDFCRKLNEFYSEDYKKSGWFFRFFISKRIRETATLHRDTLHALMLLRNYMALHEQKGKFID